MGEPNPIVRVRVTKSRNNILILPFTRLFIVIRLQKLNAPYRGPIYFRQARRKNARPQWSADLSQRPSRDKCVGRVSRDLRAAVPRSDAHVVLYRRDPVAVCKAQFAITKYDE